MTIKVAVPKPDLKELVSSKLSEYDLYHYYLGEFRLNTVMKSPFHKDRHPSFSVGTSASGRLYWRDYSSDEKGGPIDMVQKMYGLTYPQALQKIAQDFGLLVADGQQYKKIVSSYQQPVIEKQDTLIHVTAAKWTKKALQYWEAYGIDQQQLQKEDIHNVSEWFLNRKRQEIKLGENVFAYRYGETGFAIYMPDRSKTEGRWKKNISTSVIENEEEIDKHDRIFITKAKKCRMCLSQILPGVISVQNETKSAFSDKLIEKLKDKEVYIQYDSDSAGKRNSMALTKALGYKHLNVPDMLLDEDIKDFSDWRKARGNYDEILQFLKQKKLL